MLVDEKDHLLAKYRQKLKKWCNLDFCVNNFIGLQPLMVDTLPYPFNEEIKGIATVSGVPLGKNFNLFAYY